MQGLQIGYRSLLRVVPTKYIVGVDNKRRRMNRSSKGFGLTGVAIAVVLMFVTAVFSSSAKSADVTSTLVVQSSVK
jgi:hypothetical protein